MKKRTLQDRVISITRGLYYRIYECSKLYFVRRQENNNSITGMVTIIIPTYNRSELLMSRAIDSVLSQTYKNWECVVVGDGCTDNTNNMIEKLSNPKVHYFDIERFMPEHDYDDDKVWFIGGSHPRNFALKNKVRGEFIAILDDDDIWYPDHLMVNVNAIQSFNVEFISSAYKTITKGGSEKIHRGVPANRYFYRNKKAKRRNPIIGAHSTFFYKSYLKFMLYNKSSWRKKSNRVNDTDLVYRMYKAGVIMGFIKRPMIVIKARPNEKERGYKAMRERVQKIKDIVIYEKMLTDKGLIEIESTLDKIKNVAKEVKE